MLQHANIYHFSADFLDWVNVDCIFNFSLVAVVHRIQITPAWRRARSGRNTRCRYPIVSACRAAPPMPDQSSAAIFGGGRCGCFLVTARTMATASGIVIAGRTRPQESPRLMGEATYREGLWLDLRHGCSPQGGSTLCLSGTGGHRLSPVISTFIHVPTEIATVTF